MATIVRSSALIMEETDLNLAEEYALNLWKDITKEKWFPIPFWQVYQMLAASPADSIALRVVNIGNPDTISAKWMPFDDVYSDSLQDPVEQGIYYFVFEDRLFNGPVLSTNPVEQYSGLSQTTFTPWNNIIRGRIGVNDGQYYAFFQVAECLIVDTGGGGGGGALIGVRLPRR